MPDEEELAAALLAIRKRQRADAPWQADALCIEYPDVDWFAERGEKAEAAKAVCGRCLVQLECRDYAVVNDIREGIWGGLSDRERRQLAAEKAA